MNLHIHISRLYAIHRYIWVCLTVLLANTRYIGAQQEEGYSEYEVKAGFLYNFAKFVEWPADAFKTSSSPFIIGVIGNDPILEVLQNTFQGRKLKDRTTIVLKFEKIKDITDCHILYVGSSEKTSARTIISTLYGKPVLLVGNNFEEFCQQGGMINFTSRVTKYGFEINQKGAERSRLTISSKLLSLAQMVKEYESISK